jgi:hypothetical protein
VLIVDANLILYAYNASEPQPSGGAQVVGESIVKPESFGLCWIKRLDFLRIGTIPRAFPHPFSI